MVHQVQRILAKLYKWENQFDGENEAPLYSEEVLTEKEKATLSEYGWKTNHIERFSSHDEILEKLCSLKQHPLLSEQRIIEAFIAGVGGSYLRGRSVLSAWHCLKTLSLHAYHERPEYRCCWICGELDEESIVNDSEFQYVMHLGNAYANNPQYAYLNLKHLLKEPMISPTVEDIKTFSKLFELLRASHPDETPGSCERRLREAKFLPAAKHIRGVLHSLALIGVIPNQFITLSNDHWVNWGEITICEKQLKNAYGRSEMTMPWAGWHGSLKIDEEKANEIFGEYFKTSTV